MAKFPSLQSVLDSTKKTIFRFPFEFIATLTGTIYSLLLIDSISSISEQLYIKIIISSALCLVLFLSVSLFFESKKTKEWIRILTSFILGALIVTFVFNLSEKLTFIEALQLFVLSISLHLLVSFAGFLPKKYNQEEFWEFNKQLFIRIITSGLYSLVLYAGLAIAITAVHELFNVDFYDKIYGDLFIIITGLFNTIFFLAGVPETNNSAEPIHLSYPKGLKNFTQYVLMPLISLYLVILISYEVKIVATFSLPVGWVSYLVLIFAVFGILSFLLIHPIAKETGNLWMRSFSRWFYFLLVPLLGLLFWAILYRVNLYGFTHERYYVLLLSVWLSVVVTYFIIQKQPKIKFIPISMCLFGLLSIAGPQSADSISKQSQLSRFERYMSIVEKEKLTFKQEQDLSSIVSFLEKNYGVNVLLPYTGDKLSSLIKKDKSPNSSQIMEAFGLQYRSNYDLNKKDGNYFNYNFNENESQSINNVHGYDLSFIVTNFVNLECNECVKINGKTFSVKTNKQNYGLNLQINQDRIPLKIYDFINSNPAFELNDATDEIITQKIETDKYDILLRYSSVNGEINGKLKTVENYEIKVLVKIKDIQ
jgi:hypothetical protein